MGRATVNRFITAGACVVVFDRNAVDLGQFKRQDRVRAIQGDVSHEPDVQGALLETRRRFGLLDILVNAAGIFVSGLIGDLTAEDWDRQLAVNLKGQFLFAKYAVEQMKSRGGAIVNISSIDAFAGYPSCTAYDASKAAILAFTRSLAVECGPDGIRVNAICPGYTETPLLQSYFDLQPNPEQLKRDVVARHPLRRMGRPQDIAEAVFFLASDAASFITGTHLVVDGGILAIGP